jgi:hypothetical protein
MSCQEGPFFSLFKKKISRLKQKLITSFVNQAINKRTVSQEDELSTSPFAAYIQREDGFSTEKKTDSLFVSQVISDEIVLEGNALLTSFLLPSFQEEDFSVEPKADMSFVSQTINDEIMLEGNELSLSFPFPQKIDSSLSNSHRAPQNPA